MISNINLKLKVKKFIILFGDIVCLYFALFLTLLLRHSGTYTNKIFLLHLPYFSVIFIFWLVIIFSFRFYETNKPSLKKYELLLAISNFSLINFFISILYFYIIPQNLIAPKTILIINIVTFGLLFYLWRILASKILYSQSIRKNTIIITNDENLVQEIINKPELELNIKACVDLETTFISSNLERVKIDGIYNFVKKNGILNIIIDEDILNKKQISNELSQCLNLRVNFIRTNDFYEQFLGRVSIQNINSVWLINNFNENKKWVFDIFKNILDKILAIVFLIPSIALTPLIMIFVKLDSRGSAFFTQIRTGKNNKKFLAIKFRTMKNDAEKNGPQWTQKNDHRITKIGKFLRKTRLDEIPQLINIIKGDMSLVGPRPERPEFINKLEKEIPFYKERLLVKPGLTGWAQINYPYGNSTQDALEKLQYDLYYVKHRSLVLDLSIILKTLHTVIKKGGM